MYLGYVIKLTREERDTLDTALSLLNKMGKQFDTLSATDPDLKEYEKDTWDAYASLSDLLDDLDRQFNRDQ